ncbi:hypothetical protein FOA52_002474 [Chlamydomonas sp. UWO 241]|nr:hypothetical protein FOA52_002474 [Chlamydomonas sp. UWO 241]
MTFLNAVIKETLRIHSPASLGTIRVAYKATKLHPLLHPCCTLCYDVPAGTWLCFPFAAIDRSPAVYGPDADTFRPSRWIPRPSKAGDTIAASWGGTSAFNGDVGDTYDSDSDGFADKLLKAPGRLKEPIAFGMGPRDCAGQALARLEMQVVIVELFSRFHVTLAPGMGTPDEIFSRQISHGTLTFDGEVMMRMEAR